MNKATILVFLTERSAHIVTLEIYVMHGHKLNLLSKLEIMEANFAEAMESFSKIIAGHKNIQLLLVPFSENYKELDFADIGTVNVSRNIKEIINEKSLKYQIVHPLLINKHHKSGQSWNFILIKVALQALTSKFLEFLVNKQVYIKKCFLMSLLNLDLVNRIRSLSTLKHEYNKIKVEIAVAQIGAYLHVIVFVDGHINHLCRHMLSKTQNNKDEIDLVVANITSQIKHSAKKIAIQSHEISYLLLNNVTDIVPTIFGNKAEAMPSMFTKTLKVPDEMQDLMSVLLNAITSFRLITSKILPFEKLYLLSFLNLWTRRAIIGLSIVLGIVTVYMLGEYYISQREIAVFESMLDSQSKILEKEKDLQQTKIEHLNVDSQKIFYNILQNKHPLNLVNAMKKAPDYNLAMTSIHYLKEKNIYKTVLSFDLPLEHSLTNNALNNVEEFINYLKLNLPANTDIKFYRDTAEQNQCIPVQIIMTERH